jgi:hypothetical protein
MDRVFSSAQLRQPSNQRGNRESYSASPVSGVSVRVTARSLLNRKRAPCSSLILNYRDIQKMPALQRFLTFLVARSLFFSKMPLILAFENLNKRDGFASDCAHHHPVPSHRVFFCEVQIGVSLTLQGKR